MCSEISNKIGCINDVLLQSLANNLLYFHEMLWILLNILPIAISHKQRSSDKSADMFLMMSAVENIVVFLYSDIGRRYHSVRCHYCKIWEI